MNRPMLMLVFSITLLATMGISSLIPSLPQLARVFGFPPEYSWRIIAAFALPGLLCTPFVGVLADRFGRKAVLVPSLLLFALGGCGCALAQDFNQLLAFRMVQGAGGAPFGLLYATIIADTWQGEARARVMSWNAVTLGLGTAFSPAVGGVLAVMHWRLPLALPLLALPVVWLALRQPLMEPQPGIPLRVYARESLGYVRKRLTLVLLGLTLLTFIMLSGPIVTCFPLLAEAYFQATPLESGLIIACASLASGLAASQLPRLYRLFSSRALLIAAMLLYVVAFCGMVLMPALWWLVAPMSVYGLAQGLNIPLASTLLAGQAPEGSRAVLMSANAVLLRLGQNIGPVLFGMLAVFFGPAPAIVSGALLALATAALVLSTPLPSVLAKNTEVELFKPLS